MMIVVMKLLCNEGLVVVVVSNEMKWKVVEIMIWWSEVNWWWNEVKSKLTTNTSSTYHPYFI